MHTFKAVFVLGAALGLSAAGVSAQEPSATGQTAATTQSQAQSTPQSGTDTAGRHHHAHNPDKMAAHLAKKLNLSADQQAQIKPILADRQQQMQALRADTSLSKEDRHAKARRAGGGDQRRGPRHPSRAHLCDRETASARSRAGLQPGKRTMLWRKRREPCREQYWSLMRASMCPR